MVVWVKQMNSFDCEDDICNGCYALFCLGGVITTPASRIKQKPQHPSTSRRHTRAIFHVVREACQRYATNHFREKCASQSKSTK